jgi:two-component system osmolarity sensor histidine kinase EnvZ
MTDTDDPRPSTFRNGRRFLASRLPAPLVQGWHRFARRIGGIMPKGLFARAALILILPLIILQSVLAQVFFDRHYALVTRRLSDATVREIAALVDLIERHPAGLDFADVAEIASRRLNLTIALLPAGDLPPPAPRPFFGVLDNALSGALDQQIDHAYWLDTSLDDAIEVRIDLGDAVLSAIAERRNVYASNWHIFFVWMLSTTLVLILVAILFLRNQIRPIQRLSEAAERFGKGQPVGDFRPAGAREVRRASEAFIAMRRRIERQIEQRTTMLAGVSHDLRTILTRFRLELAFLGDGEEVDGLKRDVDDMEKMLEAYVAFAKGDGEEAAQPTDVAELIAASAARLQHPDVAVSHAFEGEPVLSVRPGSMRRLVDNLVGNAVRHGRRVEIAGRHRGGWLTLTVDDDGPGIPEEQRELAFRPFTRLDDARNQDEGGTGLGLAIARDVAIGHGGDIRLEDAPLGGLRVSVRIPG